jgi:purine-binding chemotaxis protein CheW
METANPHVVFVLEGQRYALALEHVERLLRAVEITPLPDSFGTVCGVINVQGKVVPVLDLRRRFGLPGREIDVRDQLLVVRSGQTLIALPVDDTLGLVFEAEGEPLETGSDDTQHAYVSSVLPVGGDLVMVLDVAVLLTPSELHALSGIEQVEQDSRE